MNSDEEQVDKKFIGKLIDKLDPNNQNKEDLNEDIPYGDRPASLPDLKGHLMEMYRIQIEADQQCKQALQAKKKVDQLVRLLKRNIRNYK